MLTRDEVIAVYRQLLERDPSDDEVRAQLADTPDLEALLRIALDSEERAERVRQRALLAARKPTVVNAYHPDLAEWWPAPGTLSADGVAIVGREGWLFLCGGTNANLAQHLGETELAPDWPDQWRAVVRHREAEAAKLGVTTALLVVPDKLAVYEDHYPERLQPRGPRPIESLLETRDVPVFYPLDELRASADRGEEVYQRTDTHLTFEGNRLLTSSILAALGVDREAELRDLPLRSYAVTGDLGARFEPPLVGVVSDPESLHRAEIIEDNRAEIAAVGGHIGTRRVFRNEHAPDRRVAIVFGDSFAFGAVNYQGISWFMAQTFREVHFVWIPFGWDRDYIRRTGAEVVLVQGAERFVPRVPRPRVDAAKLAKETLRRKRAVDVERIFD